MGLQFLELETHDDPRGQVRVLPAPFQVKRQFVLSAPPGAIRGDHAHRRATQLVYCLAGSCLLVSEDCGEVHQVVCNNSYAVLVSPVTWLTLCHFSPDCLVLVSSSESYDEAEYLRDPEEFARLTGKPLSRVVDLHGQAVLVDH